MFSDRLATRADVDTRDPCVSMTGGQCTSSEPIISQECRKLVAVWFKCSTSTTKKKYDADSMRNISQTYFILLINLRKLRSTTAAVTGLRGHCFIDLMTSTVGTSTTAVAS